MSLFKDTIVIVTGGTSGIGKAIAESFLANGAHVIVTYSNNEQAAQQMQEANQANADQLDLQKCDGSDYQQVEALYQYIDTQYQQLTILINNAGIRKDAVLAMMKAEDWSRVLAVNLDSTYHMSKFAVLAMMKNRYGRIITITSPAGKLGFAGQTNYAASKAGQIGFTKSLAKEVASRGITANCISPGFIDTGFIDDLPEKLKKEYLKMIPVRRFGTPEEVAHCALFLAAPQAAYITGSTLEVTGGL